MRPPRGAAGIVLSLCLLALGSAWAGPPASRPALRFSTGTSDAELVTVAAVGDVLLHSRLQSQAYSEPETVGFRSLWAEVAPLLARADVAYANLETPAAAGVGLDGRDREDPGRRMDHDVYSTIPTLNAHPSLVRDLAASGVDVVSTANNHALDRGDLGVLRTLEAIREAGLRASGTRPDPSGVCHAVTESNGFTLAWVGCATHTNGFADEAGLVLRCREGGGALIELVGELSRRPGIDAVIVTPHWGTEYSHEPTARQRRLARTLVEAGALAVLGTHPHVLQPWEKLATPDGREALVIYSLGNFVSGQRGLSRRTSALFYFALGRDAAGKARIAWARYVPLLMKNRTPPYHVGPVWRDSPDPEARAAWDIVSGALHEGNVLTREEIFVEEAAASTDKAGLFRVGPRSVQ